MSEANRTNSTAGAESANGAECPHPHIPRPPALDAKTVLKRAIDAAADRASDLFDGLKALDAMGEAERVELRGDTLKWLAAKFMQDADEIMTDLDYADHAHRGGVYHDAAERYRDIKAEFAAIDADLRTPNGKDRSEHDGRERDSFGKLTIEGDRLKSSLAGWHEILLALRDLAETRPIKADAFDPLLTEIGGMFDELDPIETREAAE